MRRTSALHEKLKGADPHVQKNLTAVLTAIKTGGSTLHLDDLAKTLNISRGAVNIRVARGTKIGLLKRVGPSTYEARP